MEKEIGVPINCLRINRGGEFNSTEFNDFYKQYGAKRQLCWVLCPKTHSL